MNELWDRIGVGASVVAAATGIIAAWTGVALTIADRRNRLVAIRANKLATDSLDLQREARAEALEADRPHLEIKVEPSPAIGMVLISIELVRGAPLPQWRIQRVRSIDPGLALVGRSEGGMPSSQRPQETLDLGMGLSSAGGPIGLATRFFICFQPQFEPVPIALAIDMERAGGATYSIPLTISPEGKLTVHPATQ